MIILELLKHASGFYPGQVAAGLVKALKIASEQEIHWALQAGLGPLIFHAVRDAVANLPVELRDLLLSADLTARVIHGTNVDSAVQLVTAFSGMGVPVTLLKGISISEQYYPEPHLRPMTDIDLLVPAASSAAVEAEALRLGYRQGPSIMGPDPHHGEPLFHPTRRTKVEIHTALFQQDSRPAQGRLFRPEYLAQRSVAGEFHGARVLRLDAELQLAYIATYVIKDLAQHSIHPSFVTPLMDAVQLLRVSAPTLDWDGLVSVSDNDFTTVSLCLLLYYLQRHGLARVPEGVVDRLRERQPLVGPAECRVIDALLHGYLVAGRPFPYFNSWRLWRDVLEPGPKGLKFLRLPWRIAFPPDDQQRFNAMAQSRRFTRWLARRR